MLRAVFISVLISMWNPAASESGTNIAKTKYGPIRGEQITFEGTSYTAFKGIPYAKPPVGDLRFKAPEPPENWTQVRDGTQFGSICLQGDKMDSSSEDCLTLNVYAPLLGGGGLKPVLFWVHGGAFAGLDGTDALFGPQYLVQQDIVVVTINYRLGPLGFLATNTSDAPGNWGLKDQVAAMKWVQENIEQFGGDPKQVTIYGESAGGMSVHLHVLSPLSKGLFRSAICSSGAASFSIMRTGHEQDKFSRNMAKVLGASESQYTDPAKRIQFLRAADPREMIRRAHDVLDQEDTANPFGNPMPFIPVVESTEQDGAFLTENPEKLLAAGKFTKVPIMIGFTDLEGGLSFLPQYGKNKTPEARREIEKNACIFLPTHLKEAITAKNECSVVAQQMRDAYLNGGSFADSMLRFLYLMGDVTIVKDVHFAQKMHAQHADKDSPLYNFYFTFDGRWNFFKILYNIPFSGALHGEDLLYVFKPTMFPLPTLPVSSPEVRTKDRMISFITNFVKHGNPTPSVSGLIPVKWEPATEQTPYTMFIGSDLTLEKECIKTRMDMWDQIRAKYIDGTSQASSVGGGQLSYLSVLFSIGLKIVGYLWCVLGTPLSLSG